MSNSVIQCGTMCQTMSNNFVVNVEQSRTMLNNVEQCRRDLWREPSKGVSNRLLAYLHVFDSCNKKVDSIILGIQCCIGSILGDRELKSVFLCILLIFDRGN